MLILTEKSLITNQLHISCFLFERNLIKNMVNMNFSFSVIPLLVQSPQFLVGTHVQFLQMMNRIP